MTTEEQANAFARALEDGKGEDYELAKNKIYHQLLKEKCGLVTYNLGTGTGYSVLDVVKAFEKASGVKVPYKIVDRRPGDLASVYSDPSKAKAELNWVAEKNLEDMCADSYKWQHQNPNGYED